MSRIGTMLIIFTLALLPSLGKTQGEQRLQTSGFWTRESATFVYQFQIDVPLQAGSQGKILWTLKQSPRENESAKIGRQATEYVRVDYFNSDGTLGLTGTGKSDPHGIIGIDKYRLQVSPNGRDVYGNTFSGGGWSGRIESRADQISSQLASVGYGSSTGAACDVQRLIQWATEEKTLDLTDRQHIRPTRVIQWTGACVGGKASGPGTLRLEAVLPGPFENRLGVFVFDAETAEGCFDGKVEIREMPQWFQDRSPLSSGNRKNSFSKCKNLGMQAQAARSVGSLIFNDIEGTFLDTQTRVTWSRCLHGMIWSSATRSCSGTAIELTWPDMVNSLASANRRLATLQELTSLYASELTNGYPRNCENMKSMRNTHFPGYEMRSGPHDFYTWLANGGESQATVFNLNMEEYRICKWTTLIYYSNKTNPAYWVTSEHTPNQWEAAMRIASNSSAAVKRSEAAQEEAQTRLGRVVQGVFGVGSSSTSSGEPRNFSCTYRCRGPGVVGYLNGAPSGIFAVSANDESNARQRAQEAVGDNGRNVCKGGWYLHDVSCK